MAEAYSNHDGLYVFNRIPGDPSTVCVQLDRAVAGRRDPTRAVVSLDELMPELLRNNAAAAKVIEITLAYIGVQIGRVIAGAEDDDGT